MEERSQRIWQEWGTLDDTEPAPVKRIALKLGYSTYAVATEKRRGFAGPLRKSKS